MRFFVIDGAGRLRYYEKEGDPEPKGEFTVLAYTDVPDRGKRHKKCVCWDVGMPGSASCANCAFALLGLLLLPCSPQVPR